VKPLHFAWILVAFLFCTITNTRAEAQSSVLPTVETVPVPSSGDAADDMVVWVHPTNRALSTVIGTDKESGLLVYDLAGNVLQYLPDGRLNNVDLRQDFPLGGARVALVTSGERNNNVLATYAVDSSTRLLHNVAARTIVCGFDVYGCCMYQSPVTGEVYFFVNSQNGDVEQWRLFDDGTGRVDAVRVRLRRRQHHRGAAWRTTRGTSTSPRRTSVSGATGHEPGDGTARVQVDHTGRAGPPDGGRVEGSRSTTRGAERATCSPPARGTAPTRSTSASRRTRSGSTSGSSTTLRSGSTGPRTPTGST
jgi:hypothetical protein